MTKQEACQLRAELKARGIRCVVPRGSCSVRVWLNGQEYTFASRAEWVLLVKAEQQKLTDFIQHFQEEHGPLQAMSQRSPIEMMIDKACGLG